ncbi:MAG: copper amine oxidase [Syntrophomonadaceae bacterium]|nr:copper amine oxidase [Syntrophomonadaceae bacterium]
MRKLEFLFLVILFVAVIPFNVAAADVKIELDGYPLSSDMSPVIVNDRTLVPFRAIAEAMNVEVEWINETKTINASNATQKVVLNVGSKTAYINGTPVVLDVAPTIINNRTMIPLRFFSTAFNCEVDWEPNTRTVIIKTPPAKMKVIGYYALGDTATSSWTNLFTVPYPETAKGNTDIVTDLALGWFSLDENGQLLTKSRTGWQRPDGWEKVLAAANEYGLKCEMVVHMTNKDRVINALLSNQNRIDTAVREIVKEARHYSGVNLDMEGLGLSEKGDELIKVQNSFSWFVKSLAEELHKEGKTLSLSLHAPNSSYKGYDYSTLGRYSDYIIIMAYDYGPKPEPNNRVNEAITIALQNVPHNKLILGISAPSENPESLATKVGLAKRYNLEGIALWRLGLITDGMWEVIKISIIH